MLINWSVSIIHYVCNDMCIFFGNILGFVLLPCARWNKKNQRGRAGLWIYEISLSLSLYIVRVGNIFVRNIFSRLVGADFYDFLTTLLLWLLLLDEQFFSLLSLNKKDLMNYWMDTRCLIGWNIINYEFLFPFFKKKRKWDSSALF